MCPHDNLRMSSTFVVYKDTGEIIVQTYCYCADCKTRLQFAGPRMKEVVNKAGEPINHGKPTISPCGYVLTTPVEIPRMQKEPEARPEQADQAKGKVIEFKPRSKK